MTQINKTKKELKRSALFYFNNDIISEIGNALMKSFGFRHQSIETLHVNIGKLQKIIENEKEIDNELMPILKTALVYYRQSVAEDVARKSALTYNDEVRSVLDAKLSVFSELFGEEWFDTTPLTDDFEITNFVSIQHAVKLIPHAKMKERKYDEKFHILNAPELFFDDLSYFRFQCLPWRCGL